MKKLTLMLVLILAGCTTVRERATLFTYGMQRKVILTTLIPCTAANKPAMVMAGVKEKNIDKMWVVCDVNCNCKLAKRPTK